ncbi:unnamed protein product [Caenorhabditis bovis]|uniref:Uncharacterized protein n=1 Tax=Caenorhabditis bovis TaxID=2654633 RepID=A0A8S1EDV4_9PELO|nr:unnamed protein product [Caenorhabditis bovis]
MDEMLPRFPINRPNDRNLVYHMMRLSERVATFSEEERLRLAIMTELIVYEHHFVTGGVSEPQTFTRISALLREFNPNAVLSNTFVARMTRRFRAFERIASRLARLPAMARRFELLLQVVGEEHGREFYVVSTTPAQNSAAPAPSSAGPVPPEVRQALNELLEESTPTDDEAN